MASVINKSLAKHIRIEPQSYSGQRILGDSIQVVQHDFTG